jgi:hypothetical protein
VLRICSPIDCAGIPACDATKPDCHIAMDLQFSRVYLAKMKDVVQETRSRSERIRQVLMVWGAIVLFALGFLLLLAPRKAGACSSRTGDNEMHRIGTRTCYGCAGF